MPSKNFVVRTLFIANFFDPAAEMVERRRNNDDPQGLINAMKRTEMANQALEQEINAIAEKGYDLVSLVPHPAGDAGRHDLLMTAIFTRQNPDA